MNTKPLTKAPESYLDCQRPPIQEAMKLEMEAGCQSMTEIMVSLTKKGYFTPPPRPWTIGAADRGNGRKSFAVLDKFGDVVVEVGDAESTAQLILDAVNNYKEPATAV